MSRDESRIQAAELGSLSSDETERLLKRLEAFCQALAAVRRAAADEEPLFAFELEKER